MRIPFCLLSYYIPLMLTVQLSSGMVESFVPAAHHHHRRRRGGTVNHASPRQNSSGGGFGSSKQTKSENYNKNRDSSSTMNGVEGKKRRRTTGGGFKLDDDTHEDSYPTKGKTTMESSSSPSQLYDKWGLPILSNPHQVEQEDIFPAMPPDTELIAVDKNKEYSLGEIQQALQSHLQLPGLFNFFDEHGVERRQQKQQQNPEQPYTSDIDRNDTDEESPPMKLRLLHQSPPILAIDYFLTDKECEELRSVVLPDEISNSDYINEKSISSSSSSTTAYQVPSATFELAQSRRTSTSWFCHYHQVPTILAKMQHVLGIPMDQMEEPQVVRYRPGQEFTWHYDEIPFSQLENGGQRLATFLVYLNDIPSGGGGGTVFRDLRTDYTNPSNSPRRKEPQQAQHTSLTVQPKGGMACLFFPAFVDGRPDDRTLHKGQKVIGLVHRDKNNQNHNIHDEKWICQIWIHERSYRPVLPPGNSQNAAWDAVERTSRQLGYRS